MRQSYGRTPAQWQTLLTGAAAAGLLVVTIIGLSLRLATALSAKTGDIIRLNPADGPVSDLQARMPAVVIGDAADKVCTLDLRAMEMSGGSMVIEATKFVPVLSYRVHWAGGRTSNDANDCGPSAELRVSADAITALSMAAAGQ